MHDKRMPNLIRAQAPCLPLTKGKSLLSDSFSIGAMDAFNALAEPRRRRVMELLASRGSLSATQICEEFDVTPQAISQHLRVLREADLIQMERKAQRRIYGINPKPMGEMKEWTEKITSMWNGRFDALGKALEKEKHRRREERKGGNGHGT